VPVNGERIVQLPNRHLSLSIPVRFSFAAEAWETARFGCSRTATAGLVTRIVTATESASRRRN
jgi:hypothetical protein